MKRILHSPWTRPSILAVLLLPMLVVVGGGSASSALETTASSILSYREGRSVAEAAGAPELPAFESPLGTRLVDEESYLSSLPFGETIAVVGERLDVDPLLIAAVAEAESSFRVDAVSPKGALGLMQVMPFHVEEGVEPFDPEVNLELGAALLAELSSRYDGRLDLALAAYHAGPGAVERYRGVPPYSSTQRYVERVLAIYLDHYTQLVGEG